MASTGCTNDDSLGPSVQGCRGDFNFTLKFERTFLALLPSAIFLALLVARALFLARRPVVAGGTWFQVLKLAVIVFYASLQLCMLVLSSLRSDALTVLTILANASTFAATLALAVVSALEHKRSPRPSILVNAYLLVTVLLDIATCRTLWLVATDRLGETGARLATVAVASKALLIPLESKRKSKWLHWNVKEHSPEETAGMYGLGAFFWLNRLFLTGYRKVITLDDLYPLDRAISVDLLCSSLETKISASRRPQEKQGLAKALVKAFVVPLLLPVAPRVAIGAFRLSQPFLIQRVLQYVQQPAHERQAGAAFGLIGAAALIYAGLAVSQSIFSYLHERTLAMVRGSVSSVIYRKTTECKASAANDSAALTLMSTDVERLRIGFTQVHECWAAPIEVAIACWLLMGQLGAAFAASLVTVCLCAAVVSLLANKFHERQKKWMESTQRRVGLTANAINHMKHLKISGLTAPVESLIQILRVTEIEVGGRFRILQIVSAIVAWAPRIFSAVLVFAFTKASMDATTVFTSLSYISLATEPMVVLLSALPRLVAALTCLTRIQTFLESEPRVDFRRPTSSRLFGSGNPPNDGFGSMDGRAAGVVTISNGEFGWASQPPALRGINVSIPASKLTMVVGPVASGKTTFCQALLGEVPVSKGDTVLGLSSRQIGYCDQTPFLFNSTIRDNIVGFSSFDHARYREVLEATRLVLDLSLLPQGDQTRIGSNGIQLSGGQRQRVSIARALYIGTDFLIFDDALSGLDSDTEEQVFLRVFGPDGLIRRRNATAVLCTHSVRHLPFAGHVIALGPDGTIVEQGSFPELLRNKKYIFGLGILDNVSRDSSSPEQPKAQAEAWEYGPLRQAQGTDGGADQQPLDSTSHVDELARKTGDTAVYRHYFSLMGFPKLLAFVGLGFAVGGLFNWHPVWLQFMSADLVKPDPSHPKAFYIGLFGLFQISFLVCLGLLAYVCLIRMLSVAGTKLHAATLRTMVSAPLNFFTGTDAGIITNIFSQDMAIIDGELPSTMLDLTVDTCMALGMIAVIATTSPYVIIAYVPIAALLYAIQLFYLRTSRQLRLLEIEAKAPLYSQYLDTIRGVATYRAFGWVPHALDFNSRLIDTALRPAYLLYMIQHWLTFTLALVVMWIAVIVVALATLVNTSGAGFTGAGLVTIMNFGQALSEIIREYTLFETSIGAVSRLRAFSERVKSEDLEGEDFIPPPSWPENGSIDICGVSASYKSVNDDEARRTDETSLALKDISISIRPGEKVAICGRSGSGKSSTILLLLRLLDPLSSPQPGSIEMDGIPLQRIHRATLRERLIAVPQDPVFLPDGSSFQANLDPFQKATVAECESVLATVNLSSFIRERGGLDGAMSSDTLSQGQKQLFSLARAILRRRLRARQATEVASATTTTEAGNITNEKYAEKGQSASHPSAGASRPGGILLLDEVSSSVDQHTDRMMQAVIKQEFEGYTVVMVSHRLDMVLDFDSVVIMDQGRVVETGAPRELLARPGGSRFGDLWMVANKD